ncbi:MAG: molecular chaperone TorD family protein [Rhodocyclaceae bacterium]|nr:molecular chaperone TorD family protein [Rhodocyclaceae bacterium]
MKASPASLRLLAGLLASPGDESMEVLRELADEHVWLVAPLAELEEMPLDEWQAEHTRLFVSGHPKTVCPPFESAVVSGSLFGTASDKLADLYRRAGLEATGLPPDFLGTQLECAAFLLEQDCSRGKDLLRELLDEHLAIWVPRFHPALQAESRLQLYRQLGRQLADMFDA